MQHHVFLSYSRRDLTLARRLAQDLRADGLQVWMDHEGLEPGTPEWGAAIGDAIENAGCVVAVLSPDAATSPWVARELNHAEKFHIRIIPILIRGDERDAVPFLLATTQWIDGRRHDGEQVSPEAFEQLVTAVCKHVRFESESLRRKRLEQEEMARLVAEKEGRLRAEQAEEERRRREAEAQRVAEQRLRRERTAKARRKLLVRLVAVGAVLALLFVGALYLDFLDGNDDPYATPWGGGSVFGQSFLSTGPDTSGSNGSEPDVESEVDPQPIGAYSQNNPADHVLVDAFCDQSGITPPPVQAGKYVVFALAWFATEDNWLEDYKVASRHRLVVDGQARSVQPLYSAFVDTYQIPLRRGMYIFFQYGALTPGTHTVQVETSWDRVITDGVYTFGPGTGTVTERVSCTFRVQ